MSCPAKPSQENFLKKQKLMKRLRHLQVLLMVAGLGALAACGMYDNIAKISGG